jgi:hypothetical protein
MDSLYTTTYIGNKPGAEDIYTHAETIDKAIVIESAVLAGPVTFHRNRDGNRNLGNCIMSELKVDKVSPRTGNYVALNTVGMKNIIINGDMSIAQRGTSATGIGNGDTGYHTVDRWKFFENDAPSYEFTMSQSTDVPSGYGFATSLKMDCTTAEAGLAADDLAFLEHYIEGQNVQYLKKGTANAEYVTASFWVKSTKTGTFIVELVDLDNSRFTNFNYTVNVSDTWEKKTVSFVPDTTGTLDNDNAASLLFRFGLLAGTTFSSGSPSPTTWLANTR